MKYFRDTVQRTGFGRARVAGGLLLSLFVGAASATDYKWDASSGLLPSQVSPPFELVDSSASTLPVLSNGVLSLGAAGVNLMSYQVEGLGLMLPADLEVDFRMRFVSGGTSGPRASAGVGITTADSVDTALFISNDSIFLLSSRFQIGSSATVDTNGAFHDYRITVMGVTAGSAVSVWQDNVLILTGQTFNSVATVGPVPRVLFGDATENISGVSEWQSFRTMEAVPESSTALLSLFGLAGLAVACRRRTAVRRTQVG